MNRDRITPIVLALLAVLALGASAATLNTARDGFSQGSKGPNEEGAGGGSGSGDGSTFELGSPPLNGSAEGASLSTGLLQALVGVLLLLGCIALAVTIYRNGWRSLFPTIAVTVLGLMLLLALLFSLQGLSTQSERTGMIGGERSLPSGASGNSGDIVSPALDHSTILFALIAAAIIVASILLVRSTGDSPLSGRSLTDSDDAADESRTPASAEIGAAAGRAADELETDTARSNAIYHAWREMTSHLDLQRETSTPGEFAAAAVAAGMARDDVDELTELFEATRYGNIDASEERERRALATLRRIEREYAEKQ